MRTWEARRAAYLELVASLVEFRREQYHRERDRLLSSDGERRDGGQVRTTRARARISYYQARLVAPGSSQVPNAWEAAYEQIRSFYTVSDLDDLETGSEAARRAIDRLVTVARDELELTQGVFPDSVDDPRDLQES